MNKDKTLITCIRVAADFATLVGLSMFLFVVMVILYTIGSGDPRAEFNPKIAFLFMAGPLVLALISAGVRSLYNEVE